MVILFFFDQMIKNESFKKMGPSAFYEKTKQ